MKGGNLPMVIGEEAYSLLRTMVAPDKLSRKSFEELVEALQTHLNPKPIVIAERFKFHQSSQQENWFELESVSTMTPL